MRGEAGEGGGGGGRSIETSRGQVGHDGFRGHEEEAACDCPLQPVEREGVMLTSLVNTYITTIHHFFALHHFTSLYIRFCCIV